MFLSIIIDAGLSGGGKEDVYHRVHGGTEKQAGEKRGNILKES